MSQRREGKTQKGGLLAVAKATLEHQGAQCLLCLGEKIAPDRNQLSVNCQASVLLGGPSCEEITCDEISCDEISWDEISCDGDNLLSGQAERAAPSPSAATGARVGREIENSLGGFVQVGKVEVEEGRQCVGTELISCVMRLLEWEFLPWDELCGYLELDTFLVPTQPYMIRT